MLQKRRRQVEWRSAEEALDRCRWMDTAWDAHLCQWAMGRFAMYKNLTQLKSGRRSAFPACSSAMVPSLAPLSVYAWALFKMS